MEKILSEFGVQPVLLAAQVVNFLILLFILKKFLYGPILKVLQKRKDVIAESLRNAEEIEKKLKVANEEADKIIAKALEEAKKILDDSNKTGAQILADTNTAAEEILQKAKEESSKFIEFERIKLNQEVRENIGRLVFVAFEKITGKILTEEDKKKLTEKSLKNLS
ncbi:ATP synthase F0 subunit B [Candidatus Daviesbacteria bacterium RIFCSPHIGHO2_12_FULL_37_11]|uniref:ATP synthase subunit b n=1 Tax=Candidatus Daviesbacteria bacterium RIFCSPHIGHO2_12_FULL_37_11 TaxID=1797777 RepID=A0A1F5KBK7_9BACT|nr:MAG: ATP synthase F0 subunit B [Candidatus Daviesbacteria bacterium RIFCSPHIGHO2_12_FULL_37_11]OGE45872.1 MAG: ATP synthase F0 subunit B [Candidatus Daviesbacteria bacterium RIFCSPLOWO2_01_FULL_37_10]